MTGSPRDRALAHMADARDILVAWKAREESKDDENYGLVIALKDTIGSLNCDMEVIEGLD